jgi:Family of unknown function (DUF5994)
MTAHHAEAKDGAFGKNLRFSRSASGEQFCAVPPRQRPAVLLSGCVKPATQIPTTMEYIHLRSPTRWLMGTSERARGRGARQPRQPTRTRREHTSHNNGRQHMLTITENIPVASARRPAIGTLRMQLKPAHRSCGFVQGAWWPRSTELASELPSLLAALSLRLGSIDSVRYHESNWSPAPLSIKHQGDRVIVSAHQEWPNVVSVFGPRFGRLELLVVPPYTEPTHAYNVVMTAASVNDASTPDQLLGITRRADDRLLSPIALERWESDGGAVPPVPRSQLQMQHA